MLQTGKQKEKRTAMNSLNYVCAISEISFSKASVSDSYFNEEKRRAINSFGIAWGFQRNYPKRFSLDLNLGIGYLFTKGTTTNDLGEIITKNIAQATSVGQINLGFWLNKSN